MKSVAIPYFAILLVAAWCTYAQEWSYNPALTSDNGPRSWGVQFPACNGQSQSPINFADVRADPTLLPLTRHAMWESGIVNAGAPFFVNDHTVRLDIPNTLQFEDPNSGRPYTMRQFHFHTPSEHTFGGSHRDLEVHMVHLSPDNRSILVVGVTFMESDSGTNDVLNNFLPLVSTLPNTTRSTTTPASFALKDILPAQRDYFTYSGSLTTPDCTEGVSWYVYQQPLSVSSAQLDAFKQALRISSYNWNDVSYLVPRGNYRPTQPLNGRNIGRYIDANNNGDVVPAPVTQPPADDNSGGGIGGVIIFVIVLVLIVAIIIAAVIHFRPKLISEALTKVRPDAAPATNGSRSAEEGAASGARAPASTNRQMDVEY